MSTEGSNAMSTITPPQLPGTDGWPAQAVAYLAEVEQALQGIDAEERDDLLDDVRAHIDALIEAEIAASGDATNISLIEQLGPAQAFATELLDTAGLADPPRPGRLARLRMAARTRLSDTRVTTTRTWLRQLAPAWWVLRGYGLAIGWSGVVEGRASGDLLPVPWFLGNPLTGMIFTGALIYASVEVGSGRRRIGSRRARFAVRVAGVLAVFSLLVASTAASADYIDSTYDDTNYEPVYDNTALILPGNEPVTNIYAYDRDGNAVEDVLLYNGVGNPLILQENPDGRGSPFLDFGLETDYQRDADGRIIPNLYPLTQYRTDTSGAGEEIDPPDPIGSADQIGPDRIPAQDSAEAESATGTRPAPDVRIPPRADVQNPPDGAVDASPEDPTPDPGQVDSAPDPAQTDPAEAAPGEEPGL